MSENREKVVKEAFRQTELRLAETNKIAEAADRRAMAFAGFGGVIATLLMSSAPEYPIPILGYVGGLGAFGGAYLASQSAFPREFYSPGQFFDNWEDHLTDGDEFLEALQFRAKETDIRILRNEESLKQNAELFKDGVSVVVLSGILTGLLQLLAYLLY